MNIGTILVADSALTALEYEAPGKERKLPFKIKYRIAKIREAFAKETKIYEDERVKLIKELGTEVEIDGEKTLRVEDPVKLEAFYAGLQTILETESTAEITKFQKGDLEYIEDIEIDISDVQIKAFYDNLVEK